MSNVSKDSIASDGSPIGRLDIQLLRSLLAIARAPTLSSAAAQLNIPQPTMSLQMKRLEDRAGKMLFQPGRRGKPLRLSVHGERLVRHAERIIDAYEDAIDYLGAPELSGSFRIGIPELIAETGLGEVLARFKRIYEDVHLTIVPTTSERLKEMVDDGSIDARICVDESHPGKIKVLWSESFHWVCALDKAVLSKFPLPVGLLAANEPFREYICDVLDESGPQWFEAYSSDSIAKIYASAVAGETVAAVPRSLIKGDVVIVDGKNSLPSLAAASFAIYQGDEVANGGPKQKLVHAIGNFIQKKMNALICENYH